VVATATTTAVLDENRLPPLAPRRQPAGRPPAVRRLPATAFALGTL